METRLKMKNSVQLEKEFNILLRRVLDEGFEGISGKFAPVIYYLMRRNYGVKEGDEHKHTAELSACLREVFGSEGQRIIERLLTQKICKELNMNEEQCDLMLKMEFTARIEYAKRKYVRGRRSLK